MFDQRQVDFQQIFSSILLRIRRATVFQSPTNRSFESIVCTGVAVASMPFGFVMCALQRLQSHYSETEIILSWHQVLHGWGQEPLSTVISYGSRSRRSHRTWCRTLLFDLGRSWRSHVRNSSGVWCDHLHVIVNRWGMTLFDTDAILHTRLSRLDREVYWPLMTVPWKVELVVILTRHSISCHISERNAPDRLWSQVNLTCFTRL